MNKNKLDYKRDFPQLISKLENLIIIGAFLPRERLVETDLSERMGVSRAWIRDALKILETKGLIKMVPYRGAIVAELTEKEVEEIFQVRVVLERLCNRLAAENFSPQDKSTLQELAAKIIQAHNENRIDEMIAANSKFHDHIMQMSNNDYLIQMLKQIRMRYYILNTFAWSNQEVLECIIQEHEKFITALEEKNYATLDSLAETHISYSKKLYLNQIRSRSQL